MPDVDTLRELVAQACRILGGTGVTKETSGHVSARVEGTDRVLIRARGPGESGVRYTAAEDVITVDLAGKKLDGPAELSVPQEVFIHTWIYRTNPRALSVTHMHPSAVVLLTAARRPLVPLYGAYDPSSLRLLQDGIPLFDRSVLIADDQLGAAFARTMGEKKVCLMRGHGIATMGGTVQEATINALKLNELAEMNYRAHLLGAVEPISEEDLASFARLGGDRPAASGGPGASVMALWRYYTRLIGE